MATHAALSYRHTAPAQEAPLADTPVVLVVGRLYTGRETLPLGPGLWALPVSALWELGARREKKRR